MSNSGLTFPAGKSSHIAVFDDLIPAEVCQQLVRECQIHQDRFSEGVTLSGVMDHVKRSLDLALDPDSCGFDWWETSAGLLSSKILETVIPAFNQYLEAYVDLHAPVLLRDTGFRVQLYGKGQGFYRRHVDALPWSPGANTRLLAVIMYLNTVEAGGGTWFPEHDVMINAVEGRVAMFPATWTMPHQGMVPLSGDKWIISTFVVPETFDDSGLFDAKDHPVNHHEHSHEQPFWEVPDEPMPSVWRPPHEFEDESSDQVW